MRLPLLQLFVVLAVVGNATAQPGSGVGGDARQIKYVQIQGAKVNYVVEGVGDPCLVLGSHLFYPRTFSAGIRDHLKFYFVDMRWFAKEYDYVEVEEITLASVIEDVENIRDQLNLEKFVLMGHSLYGSIAFEYASRYPDRVSNLIMIGSSPTLESKAYDEMVRDHWKMTASKERIALQNDKWKRYIDADSLSAEQTLVAIYDAMSPSYWHNPHYDATWLWKDMNIHTRLLNHISQEVFKDYRMFRNGKWVPVPTLVVLGKHDYMTPVTLWNDYEGISGLKIFIFEKSGTMPQLEESAVFDDRVLKWVREN